MARFCAVAALILIARTQAYADQEASNRAYVRASEDGQLYARSVPDDLFGTKGTTTVYRVKGGKDTVFASFPWYSHCVYLSNESILRMGPWNGGSKPNDSDLAIGFYGFNGRTKRYSTKDIEKISHKYRPSVSHYEVFKNSNGLVDVYRIRGKDFQSLFPSKALSLTLEGGKIILISMETGNILEMGKDMTTTRPSGD